MCPVFKSYSFPGEPQPNLVSLVPMSVLKYNLRKRKLDDLINGQSPEPSASIPPDFISSIPDRSDQLCTKCQRLDLEEISQLRIESRIAHRIQAFDSVDFFTPSACPLCQLFGRSGPAPNEKTESAQDYKLFLEAFSANSELTNFTIVRNDSILLGIVKEAVWNPYVPTTNGRWSSLCETGYIALTTITDQRQTSPVRVLDTQHLNDAIMQRWWEYCCKNHGTQCGGAAMNATKSLKVIDCGSRRIVPAPSGCRYVALSYVWGAPSSDTNVESGRPPELGRALSTLPRTIEDSIVVVRKLNLRYLWVDRYCINQLDKDNKHQQIQQMDLIYSGAELTIIAAAGNGPDHGLPGLRGTRRTKQDILRLGAHLLVRTLPHPQWSVQSSTWATRAWTYQEAILSRRRLIFTSHQVFWECNSMHCAESISLPLDSLHVKHRNRFKVKVPPGPFRAKRPGTKPMEVWAYIQEYYRRQLSYPDDALNAIQGILRVFENATKAVRNLSGIPMIPRFQQNSDLNTSTSFLIEIMWNLKGGTRRPGFPSWSWAGWEGGTLSPPCFEDYDDLGGNLKQSSLCIPKMWVESAEDWLQSLPNGLATQPCSSAIEANPAYINIEAWTIPCLVTYSKPPRARGGRGEYPRSFYVQIPVDQTKVGYEKIELSSNDLKDRLKDESMSKSCIGVIIPVQVPFASEMWRERIYVLVVEEKGEFCERIGCFRLKSRLVLDWLDEEDEAFLRVDSKHEIRWFHCIPKTLRHIRLG